MPVFGSIASFSSSLAAGKSGPGRPGLPTVGTPVRVSGSGTSIDVPFTAPASNGGIPITAYTAVSSPGNITGTISQSGSGTIRVNGLTQGTTYTFTVYATNPRGNSPNTSASPGILAATVPGTPTIGTPTRVSGSQTDIDVPFTAPASDGGSPITTYWISYQWGGSTGFQSISQAGSGTKRVTGLTPGTSYTFRVYASNAVGDSPSSSASAAIIPGMVPDAPTIGTATATGQTTATVSFTAPANNGGVGISSYTAVSSPGGITGSLGQSGSGTITVYGLTAGTAYTFTVYATNLIGNSPSSSPSNSTTTQSANPTSIEYLVVAGGGGGGYNNGAGGGAGGYRTGSVSVSSGITYTATVGGGGAASITSGGAGSKGQDSSFIGTGVSITSAGGGEGGGFNAGGGGGSGGGGNPAGAGNTPATSPSQGNAGGANGTVSGYWVGGGGGGASAAGANGGPSTGGNGGAGTASSISGSSTTYAGGGGGSGRRDPGTPSSNREAGTGGAGGGGNGGGASFNSSAGSPNTGGGGGGGAYNGVTASAGGSGIVIIRYSDTYTAAASTTGSPTYTVSGGYRIYRWNGNGSITW